MRPLRTSPRLRRRRRWAPLALALIVGVVAPTSWATATPSPTSTYLLYVGHGVGVAATYNPATGCGGVFLTNDFTHWRNITPPLARANSSPCVFAWTGASFTSPEVGWLIARNEGSTQTILRHTSDGGRTWTVQPGGDTGSNGGFEAIDFVNGAVGFRQQYGTGSNGAYALQRTVDGGATWSTRSPSPRGWCVTSNEVFSSASVGLATNPWRAAATNPTRLWRSEDGGATWSVLSLTPPSPLDRTATGLYAAPWFQGRYGELPVDYPVAGHQVIYLLVTGDGGRTWRTLRSGVLPVTVSGALTVDPHAPSCTNDSAVVVGNEAIIAPAGPSTWWILGPGPRGSTSRTVANVRADLSTSLVMTGLAATTGPASLEALNANDALVTMPIPYGYSTTFATSNGGVTWRRLTLPSSENASPPTCASANLGLTIARSGVAAGHAGVSFEVRNRGPRACVLDGYPTVALRDGARPLPTLVTFGASYTVPARVPRPVLLAPRGVAGFLLGYADATGYGTATCPRSTVLSVTPPGDQRAIAVRVGMGVYGGTIQALRCGEVAVWPIVPRSVLGR